MGIESLQARNTFGIEDLGLLDRSPLKSVDTIVDLCAQSLRTPLVALMIFDDKSASLMIRSIIGNSTAQSNLLNFPVAMSASGMVREESGLVSISDLGLRSDTLDAAERRKLGATGFLGAPVFGPAGEVVGVLTAMTVTEHHWTNHERNVIASYAFLMSDQVLMRAALLTVKLMAQERDSLNAVPRLPN